MHRLLWAVTLCFPLLAQLPVCPNTPMWSPCDLSFDLQPGENPAQATLQAEFKSPRHRTYLLRAFQDGDGRMTIRFAPTEAGEWEYKLTSSLARLNDQEGKFTAASSEAPGFVHPANVHHFQTDNGKPHLWMATPVEKFATIPRAEFDSIVSQRAGEKFTHLRVTIEPNTDLREAAERMKAITTKGMTVDIVLAAIPAEGREKYLGDIVSRFAGMNVTWAGVPAFEQLPQGRQLLKSVNDIIQRFDPYRHPRTTMAQVTSGPLVGDGWQDVLSYGTVDENVGGVEHQFFQRPAVNTAIQSRADLWNATMNGQYPAAGSGKYMTVWAEFMAGNRYWELEPYFDVDGGRAIALEGVEYIMYIEKPGPVVIPVEKHKYDVFWINPETGERITAKDFNRAQYVGAPPELTHDWVLHLSREGHKEGMRSYRFESRAVPVQEVETNPEKVPFEVDSPAQVDISSKKPPFYSLKVKRDSRATRSILVEWTGEVTSSGQGYRVIGRGREGTFQIPSNLVDKLPASLAVRVQIVNANGKAYLIDKVYRLVE